ncbi:MAG: TRAP transporter small permease [Salinarimonadaceae bacterium]|nr:MAG: TRAP transporter small permease [Salinarimonadaceae bacterium]
MGGKARDDTSASSQVGAATADWLRIPKAALTVLRRIVDVIAVGLLAAIIFLISFQIMGRYFFNYSISWSEEAATFVQVWIVMLGAGIAMRNRHHVGVDVLITRCPKIVQQIAKTASFLLGAWFLLVVIVGSMSLITLGMIVRSPALQIPMAIPYLALPIGMSYFLLEFALATLPEIRNPRGPAQPPLDD